MLLAFNSEKLREICEKESIGLKYFDKSVLNKIYARISDIKASKSICDLPVGNPEIDGVDCVINVVGDVDINLRQNYPDKEDRSRVYEWKTVSRVRLMGISHVK